MVSLNDHSFSETIRRHNFVSSHTVTISSHKKRLIVNLVSTCLIVKELSNALIRIKHTYHALKYNQSRHLKLVELSRIELLTSCVQGRRSPS